MFVLCGMYVWCVGVVCVNVCVVCGMYVWCVGVVCVNVSVLSGIYVWCVGVAYVVTVDIGSWLGRSSGIDSRYRVCPMCSARGT